MKKFENELWFSVIIVLLCYLFYIGYNIYGTYPKNNEQPITYINKPEKLLLVEDVAVEKRTSSHRATLFSSEKIHSNMAWLNCEEMADGNRLAIEIFESEAPRDQEIAEIRKQTCNIRIKMILKSRKGQISQRNSWGKQICDTLGIEQGLVRQFEKGIAIFSGDSLYFFHNLALEINIKKLKANTKVLVEKGKDDYWYPVIIRDDTKKVPLSYWGVVN